MVMISVELEKFIRIQMNYKEKTLGEIITNYDFMVGTPEVKHELMKVLPEGTKVVCTPYVEPSMIFAIKKFELADLLGTPHRTDSYKGCRNCRYRAHDSESEPCSKCSHNYIDMFREIVGD